LQQRINAYGISLLIAQQLRHVTIRPTRPKQ